MSHVWPDRTVKARKKHLCLLCKTEIKPGDKYTIREYVDCCEFERMKMHDECCKCGNETLDWQEWEEVHMWEHEEWMEHLKYWRESKNEKAK